MNVPQKTHSLTSTVVSPTTHTTALWTPSHSDTKHKVCKFVESCCMTVVSRSAISVLASGQMLNQPLEACHTAKSKVSVDISIEEVLSPAPRSVNYADLLRGVCTYCILLALHV